MIMMMMRIRDERKPSRLRIAMDGNLAARADRAR